MAIFKCKMCGGTLEIGQNESVAICEYCGTKQTLPKLDDEKKTNLYDRANHFRRNNDYDKAIGIYEQILSEDNADAEAYWSLVLCKYGIEYVEDPTTHKRVPTVNRAQYTSIFADEDYKSALQYADTYQKSIYEAEAKAIDEIQKGILEISQKEEPFDVFICYKETGNDGRRTPDSVLATELYHELTREGFKVFFSRITLEDKLGTAYEPYIFAALHSSKVMVALGTKAEYFNAVWVKNEWSRFLALIKAGERKTLIPAYKDMDPYDLPEEFSHLQAQDMSKLGFMSDLVRGINKILASGKEPTAKEAVVVNNSGNSSVAPLLKRAFMFLEDGDWSSADEYCERVLDQDPECAEAYLGKLLAELKVKTEASLVDCEQPFNSSRYYKKIVKYGDNALVEKLKGYNTSINDRNIEKHLFKQYNKAVKIMQGAEHSYKSDELYVNASKLFEELGDYKDADELAQQCMEKARICKEERDARTYERAKQEMQIGKLENYERSIELFRRVLDYKDSRELEQQCGQLIEEFKNQKIYDKAQEYLRGTERSDYLAAMDQLQRISGWKDSDELIAFCKERIEKLDKQEADKKERERQEKERKEKEQKEAEENAAKKKKKIIAIVVAVIAVCVAFVIVLTTVIIPNSKYSAAVAEIEKGNIVKGYEALVALNGYKDSTEKASEVFEKYKTEKLKVADVGDNIFFGTYEQDNDMSNGKEDIEWLILAKEGDKVLLISEYALDCQPYNTENVDITWENCSLRKWLNTTFINDAFTAEEQNKILNSTVTADKNPEFDTDPGNDTKDKVFLLSIIEVNKYFNSDTARQCHGTTYCYSQGASEATTTDSTCWWWLRSPGKDSNRAVSIGHEGSILIYGNADGVNDYDDAVRPVIWVKS